MGRKPVLLGRADGGETGDLESEGERGVGDAWAESSAIQFGTGNLSQKKKIGKGNESLTTVFISVVSVNFLTDDV